MSAKEGYYSQAALLSGKRAGAKARKREGSATV